MKHKILIGYGYGGWSTNNDGAYGPEIEGLALFMLTYKPIIQFVENGGQFVPGFEDDDILLRHMQTEARVRFNNPDLHINVDGAHGLAVEEVDGPFMIDKDDEFCERLIRFCNLTMNLDQPKESP